MGEITFPNIPLTDPGFSKVSKELIEVDIKTNLDSEITNQEELNRAALKIYMKKPDKYEEFLKHLQNKYKCSPTISVELYAEVMKNNINIIKDVELPRINWENAPLSSGNKLRIRSLNRGMRNTFTRVSEEVAALIVIDVVKNNSHHVLEGYTWQGSVGVSNRVSDKTVRKTDLPRMIQLLKEAETAPKISKDLKRYIGVLIKFLEQQMEQ